MKTMKNQNRKTPLFITTGGRAAGTFFSLLTLTLLVVTLLSSAVLSAIAGGNGEEIAKITGSDGYKIISYALSPLAILLLCLLFFKGTGLYSLRHFYRVPDRSSSFAALLFLVGMFFGLSSLNSLFISFLEKTVGYRYTEIALPQFTPVNFILTVVSVCLLPAVAEELAFRGILADGLKFLPDGAACLVGGVFFSLFHMNPAQTPYQLCVGGMFTWLALKSGSLLPSTAVHFLNNLIIVCFEYFAPGILDFPMPVTAVLTVLGVAAVVLGFFLTAKGETEKEEGKEKGEGKAFFRWAFAGIAVCVVMWIAQLSVSRG